jgi:hypothetical protein
VHIKAALLEIAHFPYPKAGPVPPLSDIKIYILFDMDFKLMLLGFD